MTAVVRLEHPSFTVSGMPESGRTAEQATMCERIPSLRGPASRAILAAALGWMLTIAGCGGGIYIGYGSDDDRAPFVSLTASTNAAAAGQTVTLMAAASDDHRVDRVEFFRIDAGGSAVALGSDGSAPYHFDTRQPDTSATSVRYFARAVDDVGQYNDSASVSVTVLR
jgi:hypothetical protein